MKNSGKILLGILGAAAAGVVIGMIVAPQKSKHLGKNIKDSAGEVADKLGELVSAGKEKYEELKSMLGTQSAELKSDAKDLITQAGDAYNDFSSDAGKAYKKIKN
jgi:gas vesicle protein